MNSDVLELTGLNLRVSVNGRKLGLERFSLRLPELKKFLMIPLAVIWKSDENYLLGIEFTEISFFHLYSI